MVYVAQSLGLMDQGSATELSAATVSVWMGGLGCHDVTWQEGETLMNGNCIEIGRMA